MKPIYVYIGGKYSDDNVMGILTNIREGLDVATYLIARGFIVHCPWLDHQLVLTMYGDELTEKTLKNHSMKWLERCDCMLVLPNWKSSKGTKAEIQRAIELGLPVFHTVDELKSYRDRLSVIN